jgi:hypothetical protein
MTTSAEPQNKRSSLEQLVSFHGEYFGVKGIHMNFVQSHLKEMFYKIINKDIVNVIYLFSKFIML